MKLSVVPDRFREYPDTSDNNCRRLCREESESLMHLLCSEADRKNLVADNLDALSGMPLASQIVGKRVTGLSLPIQFTTEALLAVGVLCRSPGEAVIFLADCLHKHEGDLVTISMLASSVYPNGFYRKEVVAVIIDKFMKPGFHPWAKIY